MAASTTTRRSAAAEQAKAKDSGHAERTRKRTAQSEDEDYQSDDSQDGYNAEFVRGKSSKAPNAGAAKKRILPQRATRTAQVTALAAAQPTHSTAVVASKRSSTRLANAPAASATSDAVAAPASKRARRQQTPRAVPERSSPSEAEILAPASPESPPAAKVDKGKARQITPVPVPVPQPAQPLLPAPTGLNAEQENMWAEQVSTQRVASTGLVLTCDVLRRCRCFVLCTAHITIS